MSTWMTWGSSSDPVVLGAPRGSDGIGKMSFLILVDGVLRFLLPSILAALAGVPPPPGTHFHPGLVFVAVE